MLKSYVVGKKVQGQLGSPVTDENHCLNSWDGSYAFSYGTSNWKYRCKPNTHYTITMTFQSTPSNIDRLAAASFTTFAPAENQPCTAFAVNPTLVEGLTYRFELTTGASDVCIVLWHFWNGSWEISNATISGLEDAFYVACKPRQLIPNGNFSSADGWAGWHSNISISNNIATVTQTGDYPSIFQQNIPSNNGHKYFISFFCKLPKHYVLINWGGFNDWFQWDMPEDQWNFAARILQPPTTKVGDFSLGTDDERLQLRQVQMFDLTEDFGAGHEPTTIEECLAFYGEGYHEYSAKRKVYIVGKE